MLSNDICKTELLALCEEGKINVPTGIIISAINHTISVYFKIGYLSILCFKYKINIGRT